jgi:hypothetical protein
MKSVLIGAAFTAFLLGLLVALWPHTPSLPQPPAVFGQETFR